MAESVGSGHRDIVIFNIVRLILFLNQLARFNRHSSSKTRVMMLLELFNLFLVSSFLKQMGSMVA